MDYKKPVEEAVLHRVKHTIKHTVIYSIGNLATKFIGLALLPLFVKYLSVAEYGLFGLLDITIQILAQSLTLGQPQAMLRIYNIEEYHNRRKSAFFTVFVFLFCIGSFILIGGNIASAPLASLFLRPVEFGVYFRLCLFIIFLRVLNMLCLSIIRAREKSVLFIILNVLKLGTVLGFSIYFVANAGIGIKGLLYAYLIGDGLLLLLLIPVMIPELSLRFNRQILRDGLNFGLPLIFGGLAHLLLEVGDRYILKWLVNYREAGLYHLGYRIAGVLNVFIIIPFQMGWLPLSYKMYGKQGDKRYYRKMMTYFIFVLTWAGLGLSLFYKEIIGLFAKDTEYWSATIVVPFIILGYFFNGGKIVANLGLYLTKKTKAIAYNTIAAVLVNIGLNILLIPRYRMIGAAVATIVSFVFLFVITTIVANRSYPIGYENKKLLTLLIVSIVLFMISLLFSGISIWPRIVLKTGLLLTFPLILFPLRFYEQREMDTFKRIIMRK